MATSRSARAFLERKGLVQTRRYPVPRLAPYKMLVHSIPLETPLPSPSLQVDAEGDPPPDRGNLAPWPPPQEL